MTGAVLTMLDGDARGGAALSIREVTGVSVKFAGIGERMDQLEPFRADGIAQRILGFGDVVGLVNDFEKVVDQKKAAEDAMKMLRSEFSLNNFLQQIETIQKMGPLQQAVREAAVLPRRAAARREARRPRARPGARDHSLDDEERARRQRPLRRAAHAHHARRQGLQRAPKPK